METKPQLVMMLSRFPFPLEKGDKLRAYYQLKFLSEHYRITLICTTDVPITTTQFNEVKRFCQTIHLIPLTKLGLILELCRSVLSKKPFQVSYFYRKSHQKKVNELLNSIQPSHIFCQLVRVTEYVKDYHFCPKTLDYMDALSTGMERRIETEKWFKKWFYRLESARLKEYERRVFDYFEHKTIISDQDKQLIHHPSNQTIHTIPNGVDHRFFESLDTSPTYDIVFTGNFSYAPNVEAAVFLAEQLLPALRKKGIVLSLLLAGANPIKRIQDLGSNQITVTGWVDDIRLSYQSARIFVAPLFIGTGLQNKLLEAMASGLPCVTTTLANNALKGTNHENILLAENLDAFVDILSAYVQDKSIFSQLALNGKLFVEQNYSWDYQNKRLAAIFSSD